MQAVNCLDVEQFLTEETEIIDVREFGEYRELHFKNSTLIPSGSSLDKFEEHRNKRILLVCQSDQRAINVGTKLKEAGFSKIYYLKGGINAARTAELDLETSQIGWTIDRQFRMTLGILLFIGLTGTMLLSNYFLIIPGILCTGLIFTSIIDRCYMRMGIARLPWNKARNF